MFNFILQHKDSTEQIAIFSVKELSLLVLSGQGVVCINV